MPSDGKARSIGFPRHAGLAYELWFDQPSQHTDNRENHQIFINPYTGEAFGFTGQLIILIMGLIPLVLYVTGVIRWLQKHRAKTHIALTSVIKANTLITK